MRYWNLESALRETKRHMNGEIDPIHTYRGHTKAITAVAISGDQDKCFSASLDSTVRAYKLAPMDKETYARLGMQSLLRGHALDPFLSPQDLILML